MMDIDLPLETLSGCLYTHSPFAFPKLPVWIGTVVAQKNRIAGDGCNGFVFKSIRKWIS